MGHGDDGIEMTAEGLMKHGISGAGVRHIDPFRSQMRRGWIDEINLLSANCTILSGMRIETGKGYARRFNTEISSQCCVCDLGDLRQT